MKYSIIIPVFNRPDEVNELLQSLLLQTFRDFEVIIVEDGSTVDSKSIIQEYQQEMDILYVCQDNAGPALSRNHGSLLARGEYYIFLDSDCVVPPHYLGSIDHELNDRPCGAFGGCDRSHQNFTDMQKAISYSMTSFFTTGGIRGGNVRLDKFYPRSFNMGVRADIYKRLEGFSSMRFGEDIDLSIRLFESGVAVRLFPEAWVFHKRRVDLGKFYKQVYNSGIARINLYKRHPQSLKTVHLLPAVFTLTSYLFLLLSVLYGISLIPLFLYAGVIFVDSWRMERSFRISFLAVAAAFTQLMGYGMGFLVAVWRRLILRRPEFAAFGDTFYE